MTITEKVASALDWTGMSKDIIATAAINAFLEGITEKGWRIVPDEATREMVSAGLRVPHTPMPIYRAMLAAAPKYELDGK